MISDTCHEAWVEILRYCSQQPSVYSPFATEIKTALTALKALEDALWAAGDRRFAADEGPNLSCADIVDRNYAEAVATIPRGIP